MTTRCSRHSKLTGEGPGLRCLDSTCLAEARTAEPTTIERVQEPKAERRAVKVREAAAVVTNTGAVTNAARQAHWRSKQDAVALRRQSQERMKGLRARRKAEKV